MGAPYLGVLPTGETLLSYQVDDIRHDDQLGDRLPYSTMEVAIGDKNARNFVRCTRLFLCLRESMQYGLLWLFWGCEIL